MKKFSLIKYFTIFSFFAFLITGTILLLFISNHIKNDKLQAMEEISAITLHYAIEPELSELELKESVSEQKIQELNKKFKQLSEEHDINGIKIWNRDGTIIYSNNNIDIGRNFNISSNINKALNNQVNYSISKTDNNITSSDDRFVKIYIPIKYNNQIIGVYEIVKPYKELGQHLHKVRLIISITIFGGLLILYLFLIKIIYNASKTLISQNNELINKTDELQLSYAKLNMSYKNTVITLSNAVDARDPYTAGHSNRVADISVEIGKILGLSMEQLDGLELAALFHDIGKIGIPDRILHKPAKLTDEEYDIIKQHPIIGVNILKNIDFLNDILPIILYHHERFDGKGYPFGIKNTEIPLESKIISIADTYDAMTSDRPYRKGLPSKVAVDEIIKNQGLQFDDKIVAAFLKTKIVNESEFVC